MSVTRTAVGVLSFLVELSGFLLTSFRPCLGLWWRYFCVHRGQEFRRLRDAQRKILLEILPLLCHHYPKLGSMEQFLLLDQSLYFFQEDRIWLRAHCAKTLLHSTAFPLVGRGRWETLASAYRTMMDLQVRGEQARSQTPSSLDLYRPKSKCFQTTCAVAPPEKWASSL